MCLLMISLRASSQKLTNVINKSYSLTLITTSVVVRVYFFILFFNTQHKHKHTTQNTMEDSCLHSVHSLRHGLAKFASLWLAICLAYPWLVHSLRFANYPLSEGRSPLSFTVAFASFGDYLILWIAL